MSAAELRQAAEILRGIVGSLDPWGDDAEAEGYATWAEQYGVHAEGSVADRSEQIYIATMHPGVGLALADWLTHSARCAQLREDTGTPAAESADPRPMRVARLINGGAA